MSKTKDFDVFKSLWTNINAATVPKPLPGQPEKACFLMEMPGFSVDPSSFDITRFDPHERMHPDRAVALLADRVPALAPYFYDTGSHISFYWKQLLETFKLSWRPENDAALKAKYEEAIKMLYGDEQGYIEQRKTKLFQQLKPLRKQWQEAMDEQGAFWKRCIEEEREEIQKVKKKEEEDVDDNGSGDEEDEGEDEEKTEVKVENKAKSGAQYFQVHAGPYVERTNQAFTEYDNLRSQIEQYEAAIFQYTRGDLSRLLLKQGQVFGQNTKYDAGEGGCAVPFHVTHFEPNDWWTWFTPEYDDDQGWTEVNVSSEESHKTTHDTFSKVSSEVKASYGFFYSVSGSSKLSSETENKHMTEMCSKLQFSFKVRKVLINRPWLEVGILKYPTIGVKGLLTGSWSSGDLDATKNKGQFPLLPTALVVAKDVIIKAESFDKTLEETFLSLKNETSVKVGIGCFGAGGNFSGEYGSTSSTADYNEDKHELKIHGAQLIGWVCTAVPFFPSFDAKDDEKDESDAEQ